MLVKIGLGLLTIDTLLALPLAVMFGQWLGS